MFFSLEFKKEIKTNLLSGRKELNENLRNCKEIKRGKFFCFMCVSLKIEKVFLADNNNVLYI